MKVPRRLTHCGFRNQDSWARPEIALNEQIGVLMLEKKDYAAALDHLMSECRKVLDYIKGLLEQRGQFQIVMENL